MTQVGEVVAVLLGTDGEHEEKTCYFCQAQKQSEPEKLVIEDKEDENAKAVLQSANGVNEWKFHNDGATLGSNLKGDSADKPVVIQGATFQARVAAHHLIPGNAALKPSALYTDHKYLKTAGMKVGNIGYDINCAENGIWAPGNYGIRPWGPAGKAFESAKGHVKKGITCALVAYACIKAWKVQFHDAHPAYSEAVQKTLDELNKKLQEMQASKCPQGKNHEKSNKGLTAAVTRLNIISSNLRMFVRTSDISSWKAPMYLSRFSFQYHKAQKSK